MSSTDTCSLFSCCNYWKYEVSSWMQTSSRRPGPILKMSAGVAFTETRSQTSEKVLTGLTELSLIKPLGYLRVIKSARRNRLSVWIDKQTKT